MARTVDETDGVDFYPLEDSFEPKIRDPSTHGQVGADDTLLIDCGTSRWRAGFQSGPPQPYIDEPSLVSRYTSRKNVKTLLFGSDTYVDAASKVTSRGLIEGDVMLNTDNLEAALDYTFLNLSPLSAALSDPSCNHVPHPILMTERLAQPIHSRTLTSELLFEGYGVPSIVFGIDSLFAFESYCGKKNPDVPKSKSAADGKNALVIDMGNVTTNVIPVLNGRAMMNRAKRIPWGGSQAAELMLKLTQLKYPGFPTRVTQTQATGFYQDSAYFAYDYADELQKMASPEGLAAHDKVWQLDYIVPEVVQKTEEELARQTEKRREQGRKLQEMQAKQRAEKAAARDREFEALKELKAAKETMSESEFTNALINAEFEDEADLDKSIKMTDAAIKKSLKGDGDEETEEPTFPLVDIPDEELTDEQVKEKRKQKMAKGNYDARMKLKAEKQAEKDRLEEEQRLEEESRVRDPEAWAANLREEHIAVIARMKERKKRRAMMNDRKSAAAQSRMKSISNLASDAPTTKRRKKNSDDDGFGADDEDWAVYRGMDGADEEDNEESDLAYIKDLEEKLLEHDPVFDEEQTLDAQSRRQTALVNAFLRGSQRHDSENIAQSYQVHLNVERARVPETWFQPQMAGVDSAGIAETAGWVLQGFSEEEKKAMSKCIFVTGGSSVIPGLSRRLEREMIALLPFKQEVNIITSWPENPQTEPYKGMRRWAGTEEFKQAAVSRAEWEEMGGDYIKEHRWSNWAD